LDENNDTSTPQARITANLFDIDKTPLRLAARRADFARPIAIAWELGQEAPTHSTLDFSQPATSLYSQEQVFVSALSMSAMSPN